MKKVLEVNSISDYLTATTPLPQYLPYPRFLLDTDLSHTAKLLYTLLLDRATLSQKNNWIDAQGRIYVVYPLSNLAKDLGCSISSITRSFTELENAQLVERVRSGFSKPSRILLKIPYTTQKCAVTVSKNAEHDCAEMSSMIARKCTPLCGAVADHASREPRASSLGRCGHWQEFPCRVHCERSDGTGGACAHDKLRPNPERVEQQLFRAERCCGQVLPLSPCSSLTTSAWSVAPSTHWNRSTTS